MEFTTARMVDMLLLSLFLSSAEFSSVHGPSEYCQSEIFHASCRRNEVIVMTSAHYGRMRTGKCVTSDLGYLGCSSDVLPILHAACSGHTHCHYPVPSPQLDSSTPCFNELKTYLEVAYTCVKVAMAEESICRSAPFLKLIHPRGYLSSHVARHYTCGAAHSPWRLSVTPGQRLTLAVTLFSCGPGGGGGPGGSAEGEYIDNRILGGQTGVQLNEDGSNGIKGKVPNTPGRTENTKKPKNTLNPNNINAKTLDLTKSKNQPATTNASRLTLGFASNSALRINRTIYGSCGDRQSMEFEHSVDIQILTDQTDGPVFLIEYEVTGCQDLVAPRFAWYRRQGEKAVVGCMHGDTTWHLTCDGDTWRGVIGNCMPAAVAVGTDEITESLHSASTIVVIFCIALAIAVAVLLTGFCVANRKQKNPTTQTLLPDNSKKLHTLITYPYDKYGRVRTELVPNYDSCAQYSYRSEGAYGLVGSSHVVNRDAGLVGGGNHVNTRDGGLVGGVSHVNTRDARLVGGSHVVNRDAGLVGTGHVINRDAGLVGGGSHVVSRDAGVRPVSNRDSQCSSHSYASANLDLIAPHDGQCTQCT